MELPKDIRSKLNDSLDRHNNENPESHSEYIEGVLSVRTLPKFTPPVPLASQSTPVAAGGSTTDGNGNPTALTNYMPPDAPLSGVDSVMLPRPVLVAHHDPETVRQQFSEMYYNDPGQGAVETETHIGPYMRPELKRTTAKQQVMEAPQSWPQEAKDNHKLFFQNYGLPLVVNRDWVHEYNGPDLPLIPTRVRYFYEAHKPCEELWSAIKYRPSDVQLTSWWWAEDSKICIAERIVFDVLLPYMEFERRTLGEYIPLVFLLPTLSLVRAAIADRFATWRHCANHPNNKRSEGRSGLWQRNYPAKRRGGTGSRRQRWEGPVEALTQRMKELAEDKQALSEQMKELRRELDSLKKSLGSLQQMNKPIG